MPQSYEDALLTAEEERQQALWLLVAYEGESFSDLEELTPELHPSERN